MNLQDFAHTLLGELRELPSLRGVSEPVLVALVIETVIVADTKLSSAGFNIEDHELCGGCDEMKLETHGRRDEDGTWFCSACAEEAAEPAFDEDELEQGPAS